MNLYLITSPQLNKIQELISSS